MIFYTASSTPRPVRLSEATRKFAADSQAGIYGRETLDTPNVRMDEVPGYSEMSGLDKYNACILEIANKSPLRIVPGEYLSGSATLGDAISHIVPAKEYGAAHGWFGSVSHLTIRFDEVLAMGMNGIERRVHESLKRHAESRERAFLESCLICIDAMRIWHGRYLEALKDMPGMERVYSNLCRVPFEGARNFYEAVQSMWFVFAFTRLCGNWPGIGRIDWLLGDYLKKDLAAGALTIDEAREIFSHFFIKGCEWINGRATRSGDAQHYQNLVLAGIDADGAEVANEVTYLVLDILEELGISDFPTTVRINTKTDPYLITRCAEAMRHGGGNVAIYNEDLILKAMTDWGYELSEARNFANDGCWEVQVPGKTWFGYVPFDGLAILQHITLDNYSGSRDFGSFEELYAAYIADLGAQVEQIKRGTTGGRLNEDGSWKPSNPCTVVSLFVDDCIENARSYYEGGTRYVVVSPHIGGLPDIVNSLYAIKRLVYEDKRVSLAELQKALAANWEGYEELRRHALDDFIYFGNDSDDCDSLAVRLVEDFAKCCGERDDSCPIWFPGGISTFGRQIDWAPQRLASPHGHRKGDVLASNWSPTPGSIRNGATGVIHSACKPDLSLLPTGSALDIGISPSALEGEPGVAALSGLIRGFCDLGGFFMQIDTVDAATLRDAQRHPEKYTTLAVRVAGWSARFVTMSREWQDMIIERAE